jgi:hypothetical protein
MVDVGSLGAGGWLLWVAGASRGCWQRSERCRTWVRCLETVAQAEQVNDATSKINESLAR